ncbi:MAG: hypothetical protein ACOX2Q_06815 [Dehalobacterium sp.]
MSDFPWDMFFPTHINGSRNLFNQGIKYLAQGGYIDLTAGEKDGVSVAEALTEIMERHLPLEQVTTRSDGRKSYRRYYLHPSQVRAGGFRVHRIGTSGLSRRKVMVKRAKIKKIWSVLFCYL